MAFACGNTFFITAVLSAFIDVALYHNMTECAHRVLNLRLLVTLGNAWVRCLFGNVLSIFIEATTSSNFAPKSSFPPITCSLFSTTCVHCSLGIGGQKSRTRGGRNSTGQRGGLQSLHRDNTHMRVIGQKTKDLGHITEQKQEANA